MEKWEIALQIFLKKWENKKEVIGAVVCGSYITGNPSKHSDVDVHIILDSKKPWRKRGNTIIDGVLIEYFVNPVRQHYEYAEEDYKQRKRVNAHMFCTGKTLFDKTGEVKQLIRDSRKYLVKKYPKQNKIQIELAKYHIWDMCDNLEEVFEANADEFLFVFYNYLFDLFENYAKFMKFDTIPVNKLKRFLVNEQDKKKYHIDDFPDKEFVKRYVKAIKSKEQPKMMTEYKRLTNYVLDKMGGFDIDGWEIKTPVSYAK